MSKTLEFERVEEKTLQPEDQITNALDALLGQACGSHFPGRMDAIRDSALQLRELWNKYQAGELEPVWADGDIPF